MLKWVMAALMIAAAPTLAFAEGDAEAGKKVFRKCKACHQIGEGAKNSAGPILNGIVGREAGTVEGYNYSTKLKESGITWDEANLKEWLENPRKKVPGNRMVFMGLKKDKDVENIIAYLKTFSE